MGFIPGSILLQGLIVLPGLTLRGLTLPGLILHQDLYSFEPAQEEIKVNE
jgi:hypothetical protein